jgi:hypothetical protein
MRKTDRDYKQVLDRLTDAEPDEVGAILREYFALKKSKNNTKK